MMRKCRAGFLIISLMLSLTAGAGQANQLKMVVFGDSLTDTGNFHRLTEILSLDPAIPPSEGDYRIYWEGRFSNGPVWADYMAASLGLADIQSGGLDASLEVKRPLRATAVNYAWGSATSRFLNPSPAGFPVPGVLGQVNLYDIGLKRKNAPADAIHIIWAGSDDFLLGLTEDPQEVIGNIIQATTKLYELGARHIVVANLPELCVIGSASIPALRCDQLPLNPQNTLTFEYNAGLRNALIELASSTGDAQFGLADIYLAAAQLLGGGLPPPGPATGCLEGLPLAPEACLQSWNVAPRQVITDDMLGPFASYTGALWDAQHPSTWVQQLISDVMLFAVQNPL